jgi:hypothetical protein
VASVDEEHGGSDDHEWQTNEDVIRLEHENLWLICSEKVCIASI